MVSNEHQVPRLPARMDAAGGVGDDEGVAPQQPEHPDRVGDLLIGVALIVVHAALHHRHPLALQSAEDQPALVPRGGGGFEIRDLAVGDRHRPLYLVPQVTQAGAQDHSHFGREAAQPGADGLGALFILLECEVHLRLLTEGRRSPGSICPLCRRRRRRQGRSGSGADRRCGPSPL